MKKQFSEKLDKDQVRIAKFIFKGLTIAQMAKELNCSQSAVSYRMNSLLKKYNSKSRFDFILSVLGEIIDNHKQKLDHEVNCNVFLKMRNRKANEILSGIVNSKPNSEGSIYWLLEAKKYLNN